MRVEVLADPLQLAGAARRQPVLALEAEAEAQIHQLQHRQERAGVLHATGRSRSKKRSPERTSWWKVETSERAAQPPLLPQGVFSTTSSMLAHSA